MAPSLVWFAAIQRIESKQDLTGLAPKGCFVPAKSVERVAGQMGEAQKATREVGCRINGSERAPAASALPSTPDISLHLSD